MAIVRSHVERVEVIGLDEAYLELTGLPAQPNDTAAAAASMLRIRTEIERTTGLSCSVGIGPSKLVAKVASEAEKPSGFVILGREQACARFAESPCSLIPGIGPKTAERLRSLGITTLGQLRDARPVDLAARFGGRYAAELQRRAAFLDDAPVTEERKVVSESRETTFDRDISDPDELEAVLAGLVQKLCAALADQGRAGRTIGIKVRLDDFSTHTRARTLPEPVYKSERVGPVALELLRRFAAPRPVRLVGVRVAGLEQRIAGDAVAEQQLSLAV
jgi:DNA polymerase-4